MGPEIAFDGTLLILEGYYRKCVIADNCALVADAAFGGRLVIPPTTASADPRATVEEAGKQAGVPVLAPYRGGEMPRALYRDGFHLPPEGAKLFTDRLAPALSAEVALRHGSGAN